MGLKVAIVGLSPTRTLAPKDWQRWGLAWDTDRYEYDRVFELHDYEDLRMTHAHLGAYLEKLQHLDSVYMAGAYLPNAIVYPFDAVAETTGEYWTSSVAYMLALAIHEGAEEIGIYGVDANDDYGYQRPNLEYLIGFARGRGIKVHLPAQCPLCTHLNPPDRNYRGRYGRM